MGELSDVLRGLKEGKTKLNLENLKLAEDMFRKLGIPYMKHTPYHFSVIGVIDYWPTRGRWMVRNGGTKGRGLESLLEYLDKEARNG